MRNSNHVENYRKVNVLRTKHNCTSVKCIFLTGVHRLLLTKKRLLAFPSEYHCQGQLQTPQTGTILVSKDNNLKRFESLYLGFQ